MEEGGGVGHVANAGGSRIVYRGTTAASAVATALPSALAQQMRGLSPSDDEGLDDADECDEAQVAAGSGNSSSSVHMPQLPSPWQLCPGPSLQLSSAAAAAPPQDVLSSTVDSEANRPSQRAGSSVARPAVETALLQPASDGGSSTTLSAEGRGATVQPPAIGQSATSAAKSASDRGLVDAAAHAIALASRMRARLAACLNEQLEEARLREGAASSTAQQARSTAEEAAAGSQAVAAAGARAAGKREKAGRDADALAARLAKEASAAASIASRLAASSATEAAADRLMSEASTSAAAASAEGAEAAGRAATHASARVLALEAELAELADAGGSRGD